MASVRWNARIAILAALLAIVLIAFCTGYFVYALSHPEVRYDRYRDAPNEPTALGVPFEQTTARTEYREPCKSPVGREESDLCAQWKAANAATDSARWAWASGILGFASLMGVLATLVLTHRANSIANDAAQDQLRAYLNIEDAQVTFSLLGRTLRTSGEIRLRNNGATPAKLVMIEHVLKLFVNGEEHGGSSQGSPNFLRIVGPGATFTSALGPGGAGAPYINATAVYSFRMGILCAYLDKFGVERTQAAWWHSKEFRATRKPRTIELFQVSHSEFPHGGLGQLVDSAGAVSPQAARYR